MATCKQCGNEADELKTVKVGGKNKKMCEDCADRVAEEGAVAEEIGGRAVQADVSDPAQAKQLVDDFGDLHILVNNAGYVWNSRIVNHTDEQWYAMLDVHATGPFRLLRAAGRHFQQMASEGRAARVRKVVNVSSISGLFGAPTQTRLTQTFEDEPPRVEIGNRSFKVGVDAAQAEFLKQLIPLGRVGTSEEAAGAVCLFCLPESDYVSGEVLVAGGGLRM